MLKPYVMIIHHVSVNLSVSISDQWVNWLVLILKPVSFFLFRFSGILFIIYNCYKFVDLLEKARVISQQSLERSYHIFYQIMSGAINGLKGIFILFTN